MERNVLHVVMALAIIFCLQAVSCSSDNHDKLIEKAIDDEGDKLERDESALRDIRVRYIVGMTSCSDRRSRRAAYKLFRDLQSSRYDAIDEILSYPEHLESVEMLYTKLREVHYDAIEKVKGIGKMMSVACSSSPDGKNKASQVVTMLSNYLKDRIPKANAQENILRIGQPVESNDEEFDGSEKDFWDESAVHLASDRLGAKAIADAVQNEMKALDDDDEQIKKMGRHEYCEAVDEAVLQPWAKARRATIMQVLSQKFAHPRDFRRALGKAHKKHLDLLPQLDKGIRQGCGSKWFQNMVHWVDTWFFERYTAAIRGENWMAYKESGEQSSDFIDLLSDREFI